MSMKKGVSRGIFSNEAGLGTGSIAHACADTRKPVKQGFFGIFEVFYRHHRHLYSYRTRNPLQWNSCFIWRSSRSRAYYSRIYFYIRKLGFCLHSCGNVLFCIFYDHRMGTLWGPQDAVNSLQQFQDNQTIHIQHCLCSNSWRNCRSWTFMEYCRNLQRSDGYSKPYCCILLSGVVVKLKKSIQQQAMEKMPDLLYKNLF